MGQLRSKFSFPSTWKPSQKLERQMKRTVQIGVLGSYESSDRVGMEIEAVSYFSENHGRFSIHG